MLNSHDLADRQILAAIRERKTLSRKRYKTTRLESPVQRGWRRFYVLAEHASNRRDRPMLEAILRVIGPVVVHHSRDFRRRRGRPRKFLEIQQPLRPIPLHEWERKNYPREWVCYFRYELLLERNRHWQPYWVFRQPSLYQFKVGRNWLWYFREVDPAIETRLSELDRWLMGRGRQQRYDWLRGRRQRYRWREEDTARQQSLRREQLREITRAYATSPEVDSTASTRRSRISLRSGPRMRAKYTGMDRALVPKLYLVMPLLTKLHFVHNRRH